MISVCNGNSVCGKNTVCKCRLNLYTVNINLCRCSVKTGYVINCILVLVTVTVPSDLKKMSVNLRGPIIVNAAAKKACQVIVEGEGYQVKYPIYEILSARKAGE